MPSEFNKKSHILTVTQLTTRIKTLLETSLPEVWVEGEISNFTLPHSGHAYFTLKDEQSQIRAVLFRSAQRFIKFTLQHGIQVVCRGRVAVYEPRGEYQLILEYVEPKGIGALQMAYEQLKARLEKEGLFDRGRKKSLPILPRRIGVVTSPSGAALRDILRVIRRRHPRMQILICPVPVQGIEAAPAIVDAIQTLNREKSVDVMIVGRGGGSLEDLWAFNEEQVARAIHASRIPVLAAVGHETDYTIADFVADLRAPTPSAAAEMVVETEEHFRSRVAAMQASLIRSIRIKIEHGRTLYRQNLQLLGSPRRTLEQYAQRVDELMGRATTGFKNHMRKSQALLVSFASALEHLNPLSVLSRGYSITKQHSSGLILKNSSQAAPGDLLSTRLHNGELLSRVVKTIPD